MVSEKKGQPHFPIAIDHLSHWSIYNNPRYKKTDYFVTILIIKKLEAPATTFSNVLIQNS